MENGSDNPSSLHLAMKNAGMIKKVLRIPAYDLVAQNSPTYATPGSPKAAKKISRESLDMLKISMPFNGNDNVEAREPIRKKRSRCVLSRPMSICLLLLACVVVIGIVIAIVSAEIFHPRGYFTPARPTDSPIPVEDGMSKQSPIAEPQEQLSSVTTPITATTTLLPPLRPATVPVIQSSPLLPVIAHSNSFLPAVNGPRSNLQDALSVNGPLQFFGR